MKRKFLEGIQSTDSQHGGGKRKKTKRKKRRKLHGVTLWPKGPYSNPGLSLPFDAIFPVSSQGARIATRHMPSTDKEYYNYENELLWMDIPHEHIQKYYIPDHINASIDEGIKEKVYKDIDEKVEFARERGIYDMSFEDILYLLKNKVKKENKLEIKEHKERREQMLKEYEAEREIKIRKKYMDELKLIDESIKDLLDDELRIVNECEKRGTKQKDCPELKKLYNELDILLDEKENKLRNLRPILTRT